MLIHQNEIKHRLEKKQSFLWVFESALQMWDYYSDDTMKYDI